MRVLFITSMLGANSIGKITIGLAEEYMSQGHEVKIAYGGRANIPESQKRFAVNMGSRVDRKLHSIFTKLTDRQGFYSSWVTRWMLHWATKYDPDIVWMHNLHGNYINIELLFKWIKSRPNMKVYWTLHDCWSFTGHCAYFSRVGCEQWKTHCGGGGICPQISSYPRSWVDGSYRNFEAKRRIFTGVKDMTIITPSQWLADLVKQSFLKEYPVEVRYNKIDLNVFKPTQGDFREKYNLQDKIVVLGVANVWEPRKGPDDFAKLAEMLDPEKFAVVLVNMSQEQAETLSKKIIAVQRMNDQVKLAEAYTAADVLFNPTYDDNYPTVNLEAEACGTPVITYATGGSPETIHDPRSRVITCGDIEAAKEIICLLKKTDPE